jgi:S-adenosylmethionine hydrolase
MADLPRPVYFFTDFGPGSPYVGLMHAALARHSRLLLPQAPVPRSIELCSDVAPFAARQGAYLLAALVAHIEDDAVVVAVVDPGVGTARAGVVLETSGRTFVGPDNGLLARCATADPSACWYQLAKPEILSATFHGRDWFTPVATLLAHGLEPSRRPFAASSIHGFDWPERLAEVIHVDRYGNVMTGLSAQGVGRQALVQAGGHCLAWAPTFGAMPAQGAFWYANSLGLVELAVNGGRADHLLGLGVGDGVVLFIQNDQAPHHGSA